MNSRVEPNATYPERVWWRRAPLVLSSPHSVFEALRDESAEAADARQEPVLAIVLLAGIAGVLSTNIASHILDDFEIDGLVLAVWAFVAGLIHGFAAYWLLGGLVYLGEQLADGLGGFRRSRHLAAYAAVPLALSLAVWPVRIGVYGGDSFQAGGSDSGAGGGVFEGIEVAVVAWCLALLLLGIRTVNGWTWPRALAAWAVPALLPALALARAYGLI